MTLRKTRQKEKVSDEELLKAIAGNNRERNWALKQLVTDNSVQRMVRKVVNDRGGNEQDFEDILQEGVVALYMNILEGKFKGNSKLSTYLVSICLNKARNLQRKTSRVEFTKEDEQLDDVDYEDPEYMAILGEYGQMDEQVKKLVQELMGGITEHCREILQLYMKSVKMQKIAEARGLAGATQARKAAYRCREMLRKEINKQPNVSNFLKRYLNESR